MDIRVGLRNRGSMVRRGDLISVDYYKSDDPDFIDWFLEHTVEGIGVKVINFCNENYLIWIENCPFPIDANLCIKD